MSMPIRLYDRECGTGFPLVLLHGNNGNGGYFAHQIPFFSTRYRVYAPDTRGHGASPRGDGPFTISRFADDLFDYFEQHGIAQAHLLGFSDGANIALTFALRHPECVRRLVLNGGNMTPAGVCRSTQRPIKKNIRRSPPVRRATPQHVPAQRCSV